MPVPSESPIMAAFEGEIAHLQLALRKYVARRCPAHRLPVELWDMIFEGCVPDAPAPSLVHAPVSVSQVCRRWRNIALSNPVLWAGMAVSVGRRHSENGYALEALRRITKLWLRRSGERLLSVWLVQEDTESDSSPVSLLLDVVLEHALRLRHLQVRAPEACLFPFDSPSLYLPELEHLKIESPWAGIALPLQHAAPRLTSLSLVRASLDAVDFDFRRLTQLTLLPAADAPPRLFWTSDETLTFLAEAPHLHTLHLALNDFLPSRRTLAHAPSLVSLSLEFRDALSGAPRRSPRIGAFFSLLYTPRLQHLALRDRGAANPVLWPSSQFLDKWPQEQFLAYLAATPDIKALALEGLPLYETQVIECLQQIPRLEQLVVEAAPRRGSQRNVGDILLRALTSWTVPPDGVPTGLGSALRNIEFRHCGKRCTEQALISMVDSRMGALKYLRVHRSAVPSEELTARIARWNMVVDVQY